MNFLRAREVIRAALALTVLVMLGSVTILAGCHQKTEDSGEEGRFAVHDASDCLPDITLIDQHGRKVSLDSLKGKPVLFDFIYTSCPGPCQLLTQRMKLIADKLGTALGPKVSFVSVTVDPEHDRPNRLFDYARAFNANVKGWYFLTGSTGQIDELMRAFRLVRQREKDGEIDHVLEYFLVGPDGHPMVQYSRRVEPSVAARDAEEAAAGKTLIGRLSFDLRHLI